MRYEHCGGEGESSSAFLKKQIMADETNYTCPNGYDWVEKVGPIRENGYYWVNVYDVSIWIIMEWRDGEWIGPDDVCRINYIDETQIKRSE